MSYYSTDAGAHVRDIQDDYYLYQDKSLHSALVVEKRAEQATITLDTETLESEWEKTFHTGHFVLKLREKALAGFLKFSNFRSIAWQIFLDVLPSELGDWSSAATRNRLTYSELKSRYVVDPHQTEDMSLSVNNPLSQEEHSPWAQFFQDNELRKMIMQDIKRTYPGELMFEQQEVRDIMLNILFIYAREEQDVEYKQGMHELLAPLVYVFYTEYMLVKDVAAPTSQLIKSIVSLEYLEHDLYGCYVNLMKHTKPYYTTDHVKTGESKESDKQLFKSLPSKPSTYIVHNLEELQSVTLKRFDPELQQHLKKLSIQPQLYGLRWMRLLFGREFSLKDMLIIWDALFAAQEFSGMVEYICISMLLYIRDALLCNDYTGCLHLLMRYPETPQVHFFVQRALFLRNPSHYECPPNWQYRPNNRTRLISNGAVKPREREGTLTSAADKRDNIPNSSTTTRRYTSRSTSHPLPGPGYQEAEEETSGQEESDRTAEVISSPIINPVAAMSETLKRKMSLPKSTPSSSQSTSLRSTDNTELSEYKHIASYCSRRLDVLVDELQTTICQLCEDQTPHEDKLMISLAGLKQVRDILKGNVSLGCVLAGSETPSVLSSESPDNIPDNKSDTADDADVEAVPPDTESITYISAPVQPSLPPADLETLNLFKDLSLSVRTVKKEAPNSSSRKKSEEEPKCQEFFDPLSSALSQAQEEFFDPFS